MNGLYSKLFLKNEININISFCLFVGIHIISKIHVKCVHNHITICTGRTIECLVSFRFISLLDAVPPIRLLLRLLILILHLQSRCVFLLLTYRHVQSLTFVANVYKVLFEANIVFFSFVFYIHLQKVVVVV